MEINIENMRIGTEENFYSYEEFNNLLGDTIEFLKGKGFKSDSKYYCTYSCGYFYECMCGVNRCTKKRKRST